MKAFVEILSGVVRSGPTTDRYGQPFEFAVAFSSVDGKTAIIKALVADELRFTRAHFRAMYDAIMAVGLKPDWERFKGQASGSDSSKARIILAKTLAIWRRRHQ